MTPRNPWRRRWRDNLTLALWCAPVLVILAIALGGSIAHATPSPGQQVADQNAADVCILLDHHPTIGGVIDIVDILQSDGLSEREAVIGLMESVIFTCPIHLDLLEQLMDRTQPKPGSGRVA